jgi:coenzyme F420 hydrogenase subunit beta
MTWLRGFVGNEPSGMHETIREIVDSHLCTCCGTCVAVCPAHAVEMRETPSGLLTASIIDGRCTGCGKCRTVCPGAGIQLELPECVDPLKGPVRGAYVGHASDDRLRFGGQSGGVVSALLLFLLDTKQADAAMVTAMPVDGTLRPQTVLARTREEILAARGSKYCPVAANAILGDAACDDRIVAVGLPCHMHGLRQLQRRQDALTPRMPYRIGLFCDRTLLYTCIDQMAHNAGLNAREIAGLQYRSKARSGWPGEVCFELRSGERRFFPSRLRTRLKDIFTPPRCRLCFDKTNVLCDLAVGDAWGIEESARGDSVIIVRNEQGASLLREVCGRGIMKVREIDAESLFAAQGVERRRQDHATFVQAWREMGLPLPQYEGRESFGSVAERRVARARLRRALLLNRRIAGSTTRQSALTAASAQQRLDRLRSLATAPLRQVRACVRSLCHRRSDRGTDGLNA